MFYNVYVMSTLSSFNFTFDYKLRAVITHVCDYFCCNEVRGCCYAFDLTTGMWTWFNLVFVCQSLVKQIFLVFREFLVHSTSNMLWFSYATVGGHITNHRLSSVLCSWEGGREHKGWSVGQFSSSLLRIQISLIHNPLVSTWHILQWSCQQAAVS